MEYAEYKGILDKALADYVNNGGSVYYIGSALKEYFFDYDDSNLSADKKEYLENKAVQAMIAKKPLPKGIRLVNCQISGRW